MAGPGLAQADYYDMGQLGNVGFMQEQKQQQELLDKQRIFQEKQMAPYQAIQNYMGLIGGGGGYGTQTQTGPGGQGSSPIMGGLGGAATGAYMGSVVPGIGTAVGAGAGALLGFGSSYF